MHKHRASRMTPICLLTLAIGLVPILGATSGSALEAEGTQIEAETPPVDDASTSPTSDDESTHHEDPTDNHEEPTDHDGSTDHGGQLDKLTCESIDPSWIQLELTGHPLSGHYTIGDAFRTVDLFVHDGAAGGKQVNWLSDGPIDAVILRSGLDAATYEYEPAAIGATGLLPPLKDRAGRNLAAILACYDPGAPDVDVDVFLADSHDPVNVGDDFDYVVEVTTSDPLTDVQVTLTLPNNVLLIAAPECASDGGTVLCAPPMGETAAWRMSATVSAVAAGDAIAWAHLDAQAGDRVIAVHAVEVTRIIGPAGHGGGCDGHEDHDDTGSEPGHTDDQCSDGGAQLIAACEAIDPDAEVAVLAGPFASRRYLVNSDTGARIWVTVDETTGAQRAAWEANVPIAAALARTGRQIREFPYEPAAFSGTDVVGPEAPSGPRPMADLAFCYLIPTTDEPESTGPTSTTVAHDAVAYDTVVSTTTSTAPPTSTVADPDVVIASATVQADEVAPVTVRAATLPFTGPLGYIPWLTMLGLTLLPTGAFLVRLGTDWTERSPRRHRRVRSVSPACGR